MSSNEDAEADSRQRTVAELLAAHGNGQNVGTPRRRRRREEDSTEETAPQAIIERVRGDTGQFPPVRPDEGHAPHAAHSAGTSGGGWARRRAQQPSSAPVAPAPQPPQPHPPAGTPDTLTDRLAGAPTRSAPEPVDEPHTTQLPAVPAVDVDDPHGTSLFRPFDAAYGDDDSINDADHAEVDGPEDFEESESYEGFDEPDEFDDSDDYAVFDEGDVEDGYEDDTDAGDEHDAQPEEVGEPGESATDGSGSAREWLLLVGLSAIGLLGGGAVWLGFDWLWGVVPAGALAGAVVVTIAMVWVVRKFRHAEDAQTTVLSVLAGLMVTVSPAALLLLNR